MDSQNTPPANPGKVCHDYPLAIRDASLSTAVNLFLKTFPYALIRFIILLAVTTITIIWGILTFGGASWLSTKVHDAFGLVWLVSGCSIYGFIWYFLVRYSLYLLKCGHIAVLTDLVVHGQIGNGNESMFEYGRRIVTERFAQTNVLFALDALVDGVVGSFNNTLDWIGSLLPVPGLESVVNLLKGVLFSASTYIDETIFSYTLARQETNPWQGGREGLIYYCQNAREILTTAVWVVVLDKIFTAVLWGILLAPALVVVFFVGGVLGGAALVASVLCAANARSAFLEPIFLIMVMTKFHVSVQNQPINAEWDERLGTISHKFGQIKEHAKAWASSGTGKTPASVPTPAS
jgi:hypothetical protein